MPWTDLTRIDWYNGLPLATILFVVLAVVVLRSARLERRHVLRLAGLYALGIVAAFAAAVGGALGYPGAAKYLEEFAIIVVGIAFIQLVATLLFRVVGPRLRLFPPRILKDVIVVVSLVVFGLFRLSRNGMDPTSIFTTSALITAVIALSLQDTLGNILGGLALQIDQSIQVGDWVRIEQSTGRVVEIGWRQTSIETNDWETVVVPNSVLVKNRFLVLGRRTGKPFQWRRWVPFYVDSQHSPERVIDEVNRSIRPMDLPNVAKDPLPQCFLLDLAENPARYTISYWLTDLGAAVATDSVIRTQTYLALKRVGIAIAVPARNISMTKETKQKRQVRHEQELAQRMVALRTVDIFRGLNVDELNQLAERLQPAPYLAKDVLVRQGAEAIRLYLVVEGRADVFVEGDNGERAKLAQLGPGNFFGEMGLMTGEPRTATVVATTPMLCYRLDKDSFRDLLVSRPEVAEEISTLLAKRRAELESTRDNLDAEALAARTAATHHELRQKIFHFFGLED